MKIGIPQAIFLGLQMLGIGISLAKHGQPNTTKYNFNITLFVTLVLCALLWWGGFFGPRP